VANLRVRGATARGKVGGAARGITISQDNAGTGADLTFGKQP